MSVVSKNEYWEDRIEKSSQTKIKIQYAAVIGLMLDGEPILQFPGDKLPSQKTYRRLKSYIPEKGDRVQLIDNVIQGGWKS